MNVSAAAYHTVKAHVDTFVMCYLGSLKGKSVWHCAHAHHSQPTRFNQGRITRHAQHLSIFTLVHKRESIIKPAERTAK